MDLMIDFETLDVIPKAVVISLGACFFDIEKGTLGGTFYLPFEIETQMKEGRTISASTLKWWMSQEDAAKKVFHEQAQDTADTLNRFVLWVKSNCPNSRKLKIWGNGSTFDVSIIEDLFRDYEIKAPWSYSSVMDLRTFRRFVANGEKIENSGVKHNALDDAKAQAEFVIKYGKGKV